MNPITHFLVGWCVGEAAGLSRRRDRAAVALAGIAPDIDGFGIVAEKVTLAAGWEDPLLWWTNYHHVLGHNLGAAVVAAAVATWATRGGAPDGRRPGWQLALLAFATFHLHLLGDLVGGKGPDGYLWPMAYFLPFSSTPEVSWSGAWALNAWPNILLTIVLLGITFRLAWTRGHSPVELVSPSADRAFVDTLRVRFGHPSGG